MPYFWSSCERGWLDDVTKQTRWCKIQRTLGLGTKQWRTSFCDFWRVISRQKILSRTRFMVISLGLHLYFTFLTKTVGKKKWKFRRSSTLTKNDAFSVYCLDFSKKIWLIFLILDKKTPSVKNLMNFHWLPKTFSRIVCKWYIFKCLLLYGKFQWHICSHIRGKEVALHLYRSHHLQTKWNKD